MFNGIEAGSWQSGLPVDHLFKLVNAAGRWIYLKTTCMCPNVSRGKGCGFMANVTRKLDALKYMAENGFIHFRNKLNWWIDMMDAVSSKCIFLKNIYISVAPWTVDIIDFRYFSRSPFSPDVLPLIAQRWDGTWVGQFFCTSDRLW